ncbi:MAG: TonB-dependent receptor, partial [Deltaproteobacteria bacterium]|nr:TonB-dependent receptor [Deltaproteobacteria bacterium]
TRLDALINPSLRLNFHHTRLDARDAKGELLPRRPKDRLYFAVISKMGDRGEFNAAFRHVGKRPEVGAMDIDGNKVEELSAYSLIDLAASYRVGSSYKIHARIENLTDEVYEEAWSYATPGRSLYLGVKAEF